MRLLRNSQKRFFRVRQLFGVRRPLLKSRSTEISAALWIMVLRILIARTKSFDSRQ
jgi:hypothetical protein